MVLGIGTLILFLSISQRRAGITPIAIPLLGFLLVSVYAMARATNFGEGIYGCLRIGVMIAFLYVATVIIKQNNLNILIKTMTLLALGLCVYGVYQYFTKERPYMRIGTMANMNPCSSAHLLLMPFSIYVVWKHSLPWKVLGIVTILAAIFIIFVSLRTRSTWVALFVMVIASTFHRKKLLLIALGCFIVLSPLVYLVRGDRIFHTDSMAQRKDLWTQTLNMSKDNPAGVGLGNWRIEIQKYARNMSIRETAFIKAFFLRPHNDWLWVLAETGILGLLFYVGIFLSGIYHSIRTRFILPFMGLVAFVVVSFFSFPFERTFHTMIMLVFLALAFRRVRLKKRRIPQIVSMAVCTVLVFAVYVFGIRYKSEQNAYHSQVANLEFDFDTILTRTHRISPYASIDMGGLPYMCYRGMSHYLQAEYIQALKDYRIAIKQNPYNIKVLLGMGLCLAAQSEWDEARECYMKTMELYPTSLEATAKYDVISKNLGYGPYR
jgi:O-antigen ligase